jgi:hypothetical protein
MKILVVWDVTPFSLVGVYYVSENPDDSINNVDDILPNARRQHVQYLEVNLQHRLTREL